MSQQEIEEKVAAVLAKAEKHGHNTIWYTVSLAQGRALVRDTCPHLVGQLRCGWEILLPPTNHNDRPGRWCVKNISDHHAELQFHYK